MGLSNSKIVVSFVPMGGTLEFVGFCQQVESQISSFRQVNVEWQFQDNQNQLNRNSSSNSNINNNNNNKKKNKSKYNDDEEKTADIVVYYSTVGNRFDPIDKLQRLKAHGCKLSIDGVDTILETMRLEQLPKTAVETGVTNSYGQPIGVENESAFFLGITAAQQGEWPTRLASIPVMKLEMSVNGTLSTTSANTKWLSEAIAKRAASKAEQQPPRSTVATEAAMSGGKSLPPSVLSQHQPDNKEQQPNQSSSSPTSSTPSSQEQPNKSDKGITTTTAAQQQQEDHKERSTERQPMTETKLQKPPPLRMVATKQKTQEQNGKGLQKQQQQQQSSSIEDQNHDQERPTPTQQRQEEQDKKPVQTLKKATATQRGESMPYQDRQNNKKQRNNGPQQPQHDDDNIRANTQQAMDYVLTGITRLF